MIQRPISPFSIDRQPEAADPRWAAILAVAAVGGSFILACAAPFAAFAVALAGTVRFRAALAAMGAIWLANQIVGFAALDYPLTARSFAWGAAIGVAALLATGGAAIVLRRLAGWSAPARLGAALLASLALYEAALFPAALALNDLEIFDPAIVGLFAVDNAMWLAALVVLNEIGAAWLRPWLGATPRLARAS